MSEIEQRARHFEPRTLLIDWANGSQEWVRFIVQVVLQERRPLSADEGQVAYAILRQEAALDPRELETVEMIASSEVEADTVEALTIKSLTHVAGVNALVEGNTIEPHEGLTVLFGENGTGKTGYARIFKALAASRSANPILGNIESDTQSQPSARISYGLGSETLEYLWTGSQGVAPFTRMSIFDNPSVSFHVDGDLTYVYVPASLALFTHVTNGIRMVQEQISGTARGLEVSSPSIAASFPRGSDVYPLVDSLDASTDLEHLRGLADTRSDVDDRIGELRQVIAMLEADLLGTEIARCRRLERALTQAATAAQVISEFNVQGYSSELKKLADLQTSYRTFRSALFQAAELPAEPDESWSSFIEAGGTYQEHLTSEGVHDQRRCPYCRQVLSDEAQALVRRYSELLKDKINADLRASRGRLNSMANPIYELLTGDVENFVFETEDAPKRPTYFPEVQRTVAAVSTIQSRLKAVSEVEKELFAAATADADVIGEALRATQKILDELIPQAETRAETLKSKKKELDELEAAANLGRLWELIELRVQDAKHRDQLLALSTPIPILLRAVTELAKTASDQMVNESFEAYFREECEALRAPNLQVEFVGRQGQAQRRRFLSGNHTPSHVLSEGEQKVLAIADFLAEARLSGISAPVIFDDPVSSLDHRRIGELARRIVALSEEAQVIVFTHDIWFATTLLQLMDTTRRCSYFQITDEEGKGRVHRATGPRWDTMNSLKKNIDETIQAANVAEGEARAELVQTGYDWIRAWCEVFVETEVLMGVTQRYQPNVRMTSLASIRVGALPAVIEVVSRIYEDACRYIDGHSQPLPSLSVRPTLVMLEEHWAELGVARQQFLAS